LNSIEISNTMPGPALVLNDALRENYLIGNYFNKKTSGYYIEKD